jgi:hypothetical protein
MQKRWKPSSIKKSFGEEGGCLITYIRYYEVGTPVQDQFDISERWTIFQTRLVINGMVYDMLIL